jgi:hypothetical protein
MNKASQKPLTQQEKVVIETAVKAIVKKYHKTLSKLSKT